MPLLHRSEFRPLPLPAGLSPEDRVFFYPDTGEVFRRYDEYLERYWLYASRIWSCSTTGKGGLTFREALRSEQAAAERLEQRFRSSLYLEPLCRLVHHFPGRLDELVDAVAEIFQKSYVPGEVYVDGGGEQAPVRRVLISHENGGDPEPLQWSPDLARAVLEKKFEFARLRYELEDGRILPAPLAVLNRKAPPVSKTLLKQKIREVSTREPWHRAPLIIQNPALVQLYNLPETLPTPEMQRAKAEYEERKKRLEEPDEVAVNASEGVEKSRAEAEETTVESNKKRSGKPSQPELIDDQLVDHTADPPRPEPESYFIVDRVSFGDVLMVWNFLNQFGKQVLMLSSFSLDDFEGALAYPPGHSPLIDAVFDALLRLLLTVGNDPACSRDLRDFMASSSKSGTLGMLRRTLSPSTWPNVLVDMVRNMKLPPRVRRLFAEYRQRLSGELLRADTEATAAARKGAAETTEQERSNGPTNHLLEFNDVHDLNDVEDGENEYSFEEQIFLWGEPRSPLVSNRVTEAVLTILHQGYGSVPLSGRLAILCALCEEAMATERVRRVLDSVLVERAEVARETRSQLLERRRMLKEQIREAEEALISFENTHGIGHERTEERAATQSEARATSISTTEHGIDTPQHRKGKLASQVGHQEQRGVSPFKNDSIDHSEDEGMLHEETSGDRDQPDGDESHVETDDEGVEDYDDEEDERDDTASGHESQHQMGALSSERTGESSWDPSNAMSVIARRNTRGGDSTSQQTLSTDSWEQHRSSATERRKPSRTASSERDTNGFFSTPDMKRMVRLSRREALAAEQERRMKERKQLEIEREHARLIGRKRALLKELRRERETYGEQMQTALAEYSVRTTPLGLDRDLNRFWFFHGEGRLFIEQQPNADEPPVWSYYATKAQLDAFLLHLNERGRREYMLHRRILRSYNWIVSAMRKRNQLLPAKRVWTSERPSRTRPTPESRLSWFRYENKLASETLSRS